jgi:hypothetical protein
MCITLPTFAASFAAQFLSLFLDATPNVANIHPMPKERLRLAQQERLEESKFDW